MVSAAIGTVFVQETAEAAKTQWRSVADQLRDKFPKLSALMDEAENDVRSLITFAEHTGHRSVRPVRWSGSTTSERHLQL
jgi:transposase-like protein